MVEERTISEYGTTARAAYVLWLLIDSGKHGMSTKTLADRMGMTERGMERMVEKMIPVVPLLYDDIDGVWRII